MTIKDVKDLKDKIYEIEGLLELAQLREDKLPELEPLITARIRALMSQDDDAIVEEAVAEETSEPSTHELETQSEEEYEEDELEADAFDEASETCEDEETEEEPEENNFPKPDGVITELFEESETVSVSRAQDDLELPEEPEIPVIPVVEIAPRPREVSVPEPRAESATESKIEKPQKGYTSTSKPVFTLNDRFRFRRELFGNSDAEYSAAMDLIASMENYEEAEEYFLDELGWNLENPEVKDFMDIIQKYFS